MSSTFGAPFKVLVLALGAGLRRGEIDRLLWRQVHLDAIHIEITEAGALKTSDSTGVVAIDETLSSILQGFKARAQSEFVIEGDSMFPSGTTGSWSRKYRCQLTFDRLTRWLRDHGVEGQKPLHTLRKEAGSLIATKAGILAASRFLRHADIAITSQFYADHKQRVAIDMGALMQPKNVVELPAKAKRASGS